VHPPPHLQELDSSGRQGLHVLRRGHQIREIRITFYLCSVASFGRCHCVTAQVIGQIDSACMRHFVTAGCHCSTCKQLQPGLLVWCVRG
jgi:hypothetical protein